jgi:hypothetical protein
MRKILAISLVLGLIEVFYGVLWGKLQIYKFEAPMIHALGLAPEQYKAFEDYITRFKHQWKIVAVFGLANILIFAVGFALTLKKRVPTPGSGSESR